jgi:peptidoglycan/LPS O-acetylase OafA/YrhL
MPVVQETEKPRGQTTTGKQHAGLYIKGLDGLRALSVLIVFFSHLSVRKIFPGRFGVNVFFLLSGFLITTLMIREQEERGRISNGQFYIRRALRIFPPMYLVMALSAIFAISGFCPVNVDPRGVLAQCFHLTNYYSIRFGELSFLPGLGVYWSLAVEEHFYLFFPFIFALGYRKLGRRNLGMALAVLALAVLAWRIILVLLMNASSARTGIATDTRIDSILWGCILALWANPALNPDSARKLASGKICGLALIFLAVALVWHNAIFRETFRYTVESLSLVPILCAAILRTDWFAVRLLETAPMRWLGKVSYTFYLSHLMFYQVLKQNFPGWSQLAIGLGVVVATLLLCQAMRMAVEIPLARVRKRHGGMSQPIIGSDSAPSAPLSVT